VASGEKAGARIGTFGSGRQKVKERSSRLLQDRFENRIGAGEAPRNRPFPYEDLYIYLMDGVVAERDEGILGAGFLGNWVEEASSFLFFERPSDGVVGRLLEKRPDLKLMDQYRFTYDQWQGSAAEPLRIGEFVIAAPWVEAKTGPGERKILLDPGVVFGNGLHPTTGACLKALCRVASEGSFNRVLDLGTGTGILAIGAALLGAESVLALDINPLCVKTATRNVALNGLRSRVEVVQGKAEEVVDENADLIFANIPYAVVKRILTGGFLRFGDGLRIILSGLMRSEARDVKADLLRSGLSLVREWDHDMTWYTLLVSNQARTRDFGGGRRDWRGKQKNEE
jgi:ribosomal protein L11 methyltransferase